MVYERLHQHIVHMRWADIEATLATADGKEMTKEAFKTDLPLHMAIERNAPDRVILELLKANPDAAMVEGKRGNLPLHLAAQSKMSAKVITELIRAFPEALDELNEVQITPRDFPQTDEKVKEVLARPTACWVDTVEREEYYQRKRNKIAELQVKVAVLKEVLQKSEESRAAMMQMIEIFEPMIEAQEQANMEAAEQDEKVSSMEEESREALRGITEIVHSLQERVMKETSHEELLQQSTRKREHIVSVKEEFEKFMNASEEIKKSILRLKVKAHLSRIARVPR